ncbi:MAG: Tfp pilus assembly protein PilF [Candidatus Latescibacterota bacterium]
MKKIAMKAPRSAHWAETTALVLTICAAAALRLCGLDFGLPGLLHPDEFSFVYFPLNFYSLDFNPHFFTYPTFHYYVLAALYGLLFVLQSLFATDLSLEQFIALHYFYDQHALLYWARLLSVFYGLGTVLWAAAIADQLYGRSARYSAAGLVAVGTVMARQSALASVDSAMLFWFAAAIWSAVRLLERDSLRSYVLAAACVGAAAACKYPGALAASSILAAHLLARRSLYDRRLWIAAAFSLTTFFFLSPYVVLDLPTFFAHFSGQVEHLGAGHGTTLERGWWYHLYFSLPYNSGWLALLLFSFSAIHALYRRHVPALVALCAFGTYYVVMGYGQSVFTRYALPLMFLQAAITVGPLQLLHNQYLRVAALVLLLAQPLYNTLEQTRLLTTTDTRVEARAWIERHVAPGETIANFGGWAGDVPVRTFEELWWSISHFERVFGREQLDRALPTLTAHGLPSPYYSYAIQRSNIAAQSGDLGEVERLQTGWIILHRHELPYSHIDSSFAQQLTPRATRKAQFGNKTSAGSIYDPLDAFYVPLADGGALKQPGPQIEIWQLHGYRSPPDTTPSPHAAFAQAYVRGATEALGANDRDRALALATRALDLDPRCAEAHYALAIIYHMARDLPRAEMHYKEQLSIEEDPAALMNLAIIYGGRSDVERAPVALERALRAAPSSYEPLHRLVVFLLQQGQLDRALVLMRQYGNPFAERAEFHRDLEKIHTASGDTSAAQAARTARLQAERIGH